MSRSILPPVLLFLLLYPGAGVPPVAAQTSPDAAAEPAGSADDGVSIVPEAAVADLEEAERAYRADDCGATLAALDRAEAAGARTGLLFYQQGYCLKAEGDGQRSVERKRRALPYFERQIEQKEGGVDPYYYLAATYYQDLADRARGDDLASRAVTGFAAGDLGTMEDLSGESLFRLGRLCGFAQGALGNPANEEGMARLREIEGLRAAAYRAAVDKLAADKPPNRVYLMLALEEVGSVARKAGRLDEAIGYYGRASRLDPLRQEAGYALFDIARAASENGDLETALAAWRAIRGPDEIKTPAQYGLRLAEKALAYGDLPTELDEQPVDSLDRATLEIKAVEAARVLLRARAFAEAASAEDLPPALAAETPPSPEEVEKQRGVFLAAMVAMLRKGEDLRMFVIENQLVPLIFR